MLAYFVIGVGVYMDMSWHLRFTITFFVVQLTQEVQRTFTTQKEALYDIKAGVEGVYENYAFTSRSDVKECCNLQDLHQSYQFTVNVSLFMSSFSLFRCIIFCLFPTNLYSSRLQYGFFY